MLGIYFIFSICKISNLYQQKPQRQHRSCPQSRGHFTIKLLTPRYHFKERISWLKWRRFFHDLWKFSLSHRIQSTYSTRISLKFLFFVICTMLEVYITNKLIQLGYLILFYSSDIILYIFKVYPFWSYSYIYICRC